MPRYHFHIHDGTTFLDDEGTEYADLKAARVAAVEMAGELLKGNADEFWNGDEWKMDVTDATGLILFTLVFMAFNAPSTS